MLKTKKIISEFAALCLFCTSAYAAPGAALNTADDTYVKVIEKNADTETVVYTGALSGYEDGKCNATELLINLPAKQVTTFFIDVVLPTGNPGSIQTEILFR